MLAKGATSMWERWNGDVGDVGMNSYNHYAFGAVVGFMYRRLAGIAPAAPGFRRIEVKPLYDQRIGSVRAQYDSCVGRIATELVGGAQGLIRLKLDIPANCVAEVHLPAREHPWRESGFTLDRHRNIRVMSHSAAGDVLEVGSGHYDFIQGT
jgi:alpha-L-rhamnosidase